MFSLRNALFCAMAVPISMFWVDKLWCLYWRDCEGNAHLHSVSLYTHNCIYFNLPIYQVFGTHRSVANNGHFIRNHQMECAMNALGFFSSLLLLLFIIPKKCQRVDNNWNHWQRKYGREQFGVWCPRFGYSRQAVQLLGCFQYLHTNVVTEINRQSVFRTQP